MPTSKTITQQEAEIIALLDKSPDGLTKSNIAKILTFSIQNKTLQRRLTTLSESGKIIRKGKLKNTRYYPQQIPPNQQQATTASEQATTENKGHLKDTLAPIFSQKARKTLQTLKTPLYAREKVSYKREFLDTYVPNQSQYVPVSLRQRLFDAGKRIDKQLAAGTYARQISQRLLIDLSYHSSRLEGNTYSLLDTKQLIEEGTFAKDKVQEETVMIMNHKEAILFLVENAQDIELNSLTIRNVHHLLSQDLLGNPEACGNIRTIDVSIGQSTYQPLNNPHVLKELFELILLKAKKINDPFEQSFFLLAHLSYLQAFEDVNKRTSRLSCNIPFIKHNLCPLSFTDVTREDYSAAIITLYELNDITPLLELFTWAYAQSCKQYGVVKQSLGEIDAFRIQYRSHRKTVMGQIIKKDLHGTAAETWIANYGQEHNIDDVEKFTAMTLADLSQLHTGAIIGLNITERQFEEWLAGRE